jgi:hypothetical protein
MFAHLLLLQHLIIYLDLMIGLSIHGNLGDDEAANKRLGAVKEAGAQTLIGVGLGVHKKLNFGRLNVPVGLLYKYQLATITGENEIAPYITSGSYYSTVPQTYLDEGLSLGGHAAELHLGVQFMVNQDIMIHAGYHMDVYNELNSVKVGEEELEFGTGLGQVDINKDFYKSSFLTIGIDYTLKELPVNIFGSLDPLKKY